MSVFSDVGQLAVLIPRPSPLPSISLPAAKGFGGSVKGQWLKGGLASLRAELSFGGNGEACRASAAFFCLHLSMHQDVKATSSLGLSVDLLNGGLYIKCLPRSSTLLLEPCGSPNSNFKGIVAFHFSSSDVVGSFLTMLQAASALYCPQKNHTFPAGVDLRSDLHHHHHQQQQQQQQQRQQQEEQQLQVKLPQRGWEMLQGAKKEELQQMIEAYITQPGFLEFVDRLEDVWKEMIGSSNLSQARHE